MKISNNPAQHLSNLEVLNHFVNLHTENTKLQALQRDHKLRTDAQTRMNYPHRDDRDKEYESPVAVQAVEGEEDAERRGTAGDLVWIQDQVIKYLCAEHNVTSRQTEDGVATLADSLQDHGLTKGEVLQIVNLAPIEMVELYCIIEEPDERFPETPARLEEISQQIQATLLPEPPAHLAPFLPKVLTNGHAHGQAGEGDEGGYDEGEEEMRAALAEQEFVHESEWGAGHEEGVGEEKENPLE